MNHRLRKKFIKYKRKKPLSPVQMPVKHSIKSRGELQDDRRTSHRSVVNSLSTMSYLTQRTNHGKNTQSRIPKLQSNYGKYLPIHEQNIMYNGSDTSKYSKDGTRRTTKNGIVKKKSFEETKTLSLPRIPSTTAHRSKHNTFESDTMKLARHLNLITARPKSIVTDSIKGTHKYAADTKTISHGQSLPKITMDEVLKSWDVQQPNAKGKKSPAKYDPMDFLMRKEMQTNLTSSVNNYDELKSCRYLRLDKMEEQTHGKCCPCNSCEHGKGLKKSPYLNA